MAGNTDRCKTSNNGNLEYLAFALIVNSVKLSFTLVVNSVKLSFTLVVNSVKLPFTLVVNWSSNPEDVGSIHSLEGLGQFHFS